MPEALCEGRAYSVCRHVYTCESGHLARSRPTAPNDSESALAGTQPLPRRRRRTQADITGSVGCTVTVTVVLGCTSTGSTLWSSGTQAVHHEYISHGLFLGGSTHRDCDAPMPDCL